MCWAKMTMRLLVAVSVLCGWLAVPAWGQDGAALRELRKLHDELVNPQEVVTPDDARQARERLAEWGLDPDKLKPADRGRLGRVLVYVALAEGDAATALSQAETLLGEFPDDPATLGAAYLAGCAAADAKLAADAVKKLSKGAKGDDRRVFSLRRRWIRGFGKKAPDVVIRTEDGTRYATTRRGERVLVIDFWNVLTPPAKEDVAALRELYKRHRNSRNVEFVGVNTDGESRLARAKQFAEDSGYAWEQCYEQAVQDDSPARKTFRAGKPPWCVLVDTMGYVRAIGSAREPGFQYALRAAMAEAGGDREVVMPRTIDGQRAERPSDGIKPQVKKDKSAGVDGELPSNLEARQKLQRANLFRRTGKRTAAKKLYEEIVRDYPGTIEAREAQEFLDTVFNP